MFTTPTKCEVEKVPENLQLEVIELQEDLILKSKYDEVELSEFYKSYLTDENYPQLRALARKKICLFGSIYKCEQFFSLMKINQCKTRTRVTDDNLENTLRLCVSSIKPNINNLVSVSPKLTLMSQRIFE